MKNLSLLILFCTAFLASCQNDAPSEGTPESVDLIVESSTLAAEIRLLEDSLRNQNSPKLNKPAAFDLIAKSEAFAASFPKDPKAPALLFQAADVARGIGEYDLAIKHWTTVYTKYPEYDKAPDAYFLIGFTYENDVKDKDTAKKFYEDFITKYPDDNLVPQVKQLLKVIDKTPEELIKSFQKNQQQ